jgi:hypothetical protein
LKLRDVLALLAPMVVLAAVASGSSLEQAETRVRASTDSVAAGILDFAPSAAFTQFGNGQSYDELASDSTLAPEAGGTTPFRSMQVAEDGTPLTGATARTLGIRPGEIPTDEGGMVRPGTGGMSVAPDSPYNLQPHRLPVAMGGTGKDPLWWIGESDLGPSLSYRADPELAGHGFVEPSGPMSLEEYIAALESTAGSWSRP